MQVKNFRRLYWRERFLHVDAVKISAIHWTLTIFHNEPWESVRYLCRSEHAGHVCFTVTWGEGGFYSLYNKTPVWSSTEQNETNKEQGK